MPAYETHVTIYLDAESEDDAANIVESLMLNDPFIADFEIENVFTDRSTGSTLNYDEDAESTILNTGGLPPEEK